MASSSKESPSNNPGLGTPDEATKEYFLQQAVSKLLVFLLYKKLVLVLSFL